MNKRHFLKAGLGMAGLSLLDPLQSVESFAASPLVELPKLPYAFNALEPFIDARTMEIHYTRHHGAYVEKLNAELTKGSFQFGSTEELLVKYADKNLTIRNQGGGHWNHSLFWRCLTSPEKSRMSTEMAMHLITHFNSEEVFRAQFQEAALSWFGSGWVWLCKGSDGKLFITSTPNQDNPIMKLKGIHNGKPVLGLDVWEHSYYLQYQNKRVDYINAFFKVINWAEVERLINQP